MLSGVAIYLWLRATLRVEGAPVGRRKVKDVHASKLIALVLFLPLWTNGQSIQPFHDAKDIVFKPELLGKWDLEGVVIEFRDAGERTYGINLSYDEEGVTRLRARLIHLGSHYFLDGQISGFESPEPDTPEGRSRVQLGKDEPNETFSLDNNDIFLNRHHGLILIQFHRE